MCVTLAPYTGSLYHPLQNSADSGWIFAQHFCNRLGSSYLALKNLLDESNPNHAEVLNDIKRRFREETFTREYIEQILQAHPELVGKLNQPVLDREQTRAAVGPTSLRQLCHEPLPRIRWCPIDVRVFLLRSREMILTSV